MTKTALITGATSGIGEAAARAFAAAGWQVIATGRRSERLKALVDAVGVDKVHPAAFDVADESARDAALAARVAAVLDRDEAGNLVRKAGVMGVVLVGGEVRPGDAVVVRLPDGPHRPLEPV